MLNNSYIKFYWLETEFFPEIHKFFHKEHYLKPEHFFSIIIWKRNASKTIIKRGLLENGLSLDVAVRNLTGEIFKADKEKKLDILLQRKGFQLAIASALLTVLYPDDFTVYDVRVRGQLNNYPDITYVENNIERYFTEYLPRVLKMGREITQNPALSLRDCDRVLWAKSWYGNLQRFLRT